MKSGHPWQLNQVKDGKTPAYPFSQTVLQPPQGYTWQDITYIIGGYNWKARFLDKNGYIVTGPPDGSGGADYLNQFNLSNPLLSKNGTWVNYHSGEAKLPYNCGACHTTGYSANGHQDKLEGITGTWAEPGVQCEACHGPGSLHASNPTGVRMIIERDSALCTQCHLPGPQRTPAADGATTAAATQTVTSTQGVSSTQVTAANLFIQHNDQYGGMFLGKHDILSCLSCHDPHTGVVQASQTTTPASASQVCASCHFQEAQFQKNQKHTAVNVSCIDCHMPRLIQSAWSIPQRYTADIRSHVMTIDPYLINQAGPDGQPISQAVSLDLACRQCHNQQLGSVKADQQLTNMAIGYHARPTSQSGK
ncbi:MAG TPA: cytochrome c3 family protein [Anaerolineales bacterium]